jgi:hypothetical protein
VWKRLTVATEWDRLFFSGATFNQSEATIGAKLLIAGTSINSDIFKVQRSGMEPRRIVKVRLVVIAASRKGMIDHLINWAI